MHKARQYHTILYAIHFLIRLNANFSVVKYKILLMDPLPPMNNIFSVVLQHERQGNFNPVDDSKALVNATDSQRFKGKNIGIWKL